MINIFGTDGIRGTVGLPPFTKEHLPNVGHAIAQWSLAKYGPNPTILLAHDTRISCAWIKATLKSCFLLHNITIYDAHILPTPAICKLIKQNSIFHCGIIISASHNPYQDNGIKIIDAHNGKLDTKDENIISTLAQKRKQLSINYACLGQNLSYTCAQQEYMHTILQYFDKNIFQGSTIVLDCAHGSTSVIAPQIFDALGIKTIVINNQPNGGNINHNCGTLFPLSLQKAVLIHQADAGFAFDGDGDRIIAVNNKGTIKNGDDILALLSNHPRYMQEKNIVGTIMTNQGLELFLKENNKNLIRTHVGDRPVSKKLVENTMLLGGEQSGHIITRDYLDTGDSIFTALRTLETILLTKNYEMDTFTKYPQTLINIPITKRKDLEKPPIKPIIAAYKDQLSSGRLEVRYSGTEPYLRIMIEDKNEKKMREIGSQLLEDLKKELYEV